jgi:hypothetical protein
MTVQKSVKPLTEPTVNGPQSKPVWSADFQINEYECLRLELRQHRTHAAIDVRRWRRSPHGDLRATERGFALALQHLRAMKVLVDAAVVRAQAAGLLNDTVKGGAS